MEKLGLITVLSIIAIIDQSISDEGFCTKDDKTCQQETKSQMIPTRPNIILLLVDDMGYGDLASYGNPIQEQGAVDDLAHGGLRFTQFYSADSMCSPSRVGLLTGRLPIRSGVVGGRRVFVDFDTGGLPAGEVTIAEALRDLGYDTGFVGKWHLGINSKTNTDGVHLPSAHGFDFVGHNLPLTDLWACDESGSLMKKGPDRTKCYVYKGDRIVQQPISHATLTDRFISDFQTFLNSTKEEKPFFFYFSFHQVHTSLETASKFHGLSNRGPFGDSIMEMQDAVGRIHESIKSKNLLEKTLIIFLSDHGPQKEACTYGGSTGGLRGGKTNSFEGGVRIPAIAYWPTVIKAGTISQQVLSSLDLFPSLIALAGGDVPDGSDRIYDGLDAHLALIDRSDQTLIDKLNKRTLYFYCNEKLAAVRHRNWKFHLLTSPEITSEDVEKYCPNGGIPNKDWSKAQLCSDGDMIKHEFPLIFDLHRDPYENYPLPKESIKEQWDKVRVLVQKHKKSIVAVEQQLGNYNPKVIPCCSHPKCECNYP